MNIEQLLSSITDSEVALARSRFAYGGSRSDLIFVRGQGSKLWDHRGKEYIDCNAQAFVLNVGHNHPRVVEAAMYQLQRLVHLRGGFDHIPRLKLINKLVEIIPPGLNRVTFYPCGSLAVEGALKLALINKSGADTFVVLEHGYHGRSFATMGASYPMPIARFKMFGPEFIRVPSPYCYRCFFGCADSCSLECARMLEEVLKFSGDGKIAGVLLEPVLGNGGQIPCPQRYLREVRSICDKHGVLLIFDEVQTGFGRIGAMFAAELFGVTPDLLVMGKAIAGGFPLAAIAIDHRLDTFQSFEDTYTWATHPVACAAALAAIAVIKEDNLPERARRLGEWATQRVREIQKADLGKVKIGDVRGPGLAIGVELVRDLKTKEPANQETIALVQRALERGVILGKDRFGKYGNVVKIKPPLVIPDGELLRSLEVFEEVLMEL